MVNNENLRRLVRGVYATKQAGERRLVTNGPIYDLAIAQRLLRLFGLHVINDDADKDMVTEFRPALTTKQLTEIILKLTDSHYAGSEICDTTPGMVVDADAYTIYWNRTRSIESMIAGTKIYLKFGFRESNPKCLILSAHPAKH